MIMISQPLVLRSLDATWDYVRWAELPDDGNRYEVIDGVLYMTTAPSNFHQWIVTRLLRFVGIPLEDQALAYMLTAPLGVLMPGCDPVQPDLVVVRRDRAAIIADRRIRGVPDLIAEVLSPGNAEQDTLTKRVAYARAGVPEYWVVRPATRDVIVHSEPDALLGDYTHVDRVAADGELRSATFPLHIPAALLFDGAPDTTL